MSEIREDGARFTGYEYKEITAQGETAAMYLDCYQSFGWVLDKRAQDGAAKSKFVLKRERRIVNRTELTRLQRHFEACMDEIASLERSKSANAAMAAISTGILGTAFMAGSVFAVTHEPPLYVLSVILAIPGFVGWALPYFVYQKLLARRVKVVAELVDQKYDEIYDICEQGNKLLS